MRWIIIVLLVLAACSQASEDNTRWEDPRTITLLASDGSFEVTLYPNSKSQTLVLSPAINDDLRSENVMIINNPTSSQLEAIEQFANRNDYTIER